MDKERHPIVVRTWKAGKTQAPKPRPAAPMPRTHRAPEPPPRNT
jgi:hypothetical protein